MPNTAVNKDAVSQVKPVTLFDIKGNASTKTRQEAKPSKAIAPKNKLVTQTLNKPSLDVTTQRMASSIAGKLKTMSPEELKSTLGDLDITPENFSEHMDTAFNSLGDEQSTELVTKLLSDNGVTAKDLQKLQNDPEFQAAFGVDADAATPDVNNSTKTLINHMKDAFSSNPYLLVLTLGNKSSKMNFQVQGSALLNMQNVQNSMHETTKGLNQNVQNTKNEEAQNDSKHWWQKLLKIVVTVVVAVVVAVVVNVVANVVLPGLGFALDGLIAAGAAALEVGAEVGVDSAEFAVEMTEMGEEVGKAADTAAKGAEDASKGAKDASKVAEDSEGLDGEVGDPNDVDTEARTAQETLNATENGEAKTEAFVKDEGARRKMSKAINELSDMVTKAKSYVSDAYEGVTNSVKDSFKETKTGAKYFERDAAGKNIGKKASNFLLDKMPSTKMLAGILALGGVTAEAMVPASNTNAKVAILQTEANIMNLGMQSMNLSYQSDQQLVNTQDQNNQNVQMDESYALSIAQKMNTVPA